MMLRLKSIFGLVSHDEWEELQKSRAIERELRISKRKSKFEIKILMLGELISHGIFRSKNGEEFLLKVEDFRSWRIREEHVHKTNENCSW